MNQEAIKKQAEDIMQKFAAKLQKVSFKEKFVEREETMRDEKGETADIDREIMFSNAPKVKDDCIEAEKGAWI